MLINVIGSTSEKKESKINTSLIVQISYLRTNYTESIIEEKIDLKNQFNFKELLTPFSTTKLLQKLMLTISLAFHQR